MNKLAISSILFCLLLLVEVVGVNVFKNSCPYSGKTSFYFFTNGCCCSSTAENGGCCDSKQTYVALEMDEVDEIPAYEQMTSYEFVIPSFDLVLPFKLKNSLLTLETILIKPPPKLSVALNVLNQCFRI